MLFVCHPKILHKHCLQFLLGVKMAPRETENNAYAKFWTDKQRALWYVMVFSGVPSMAMFHWMESHFHDWIDYNGVAFSVKLLEQTTTQTELPLSSRIIQLLSSSYFHHCPKKYKYSSIIQSVQTSISVSTHGCF